MKRTRIRWRRRYGAALLALVLAVLGLLPAPAGAEEAKPALELLEVGWDGQITSGTWAPLRVKVTGAGRDLDAVVEVTLENVYNTAPNTTVRVPLGSFAQEVSLPANSTKEVTIWAPTSHGFTGTIRLKVGGEEVAARQFNLMPTKAPWWPLVGVLASEESLAPAVGRIQLTLRELPAAINVARLKAEWLPDSAERLRGLHAIAVQGNAPAALTDEQRQAILKWVEQGGHLLLAGGPDSALTAAVLPAGALPVTFAGAEKEVDLTPLAAWAGATGPLKGPAVRMQPSGGTVLAGTPERPLAWRTSLGKGTITVLGVDPTLEPLASWDSLTALLKAALKPAFFDEMTPEEEKYRMVYEQQEMVNRLRHVLDLLPSDAYPDWKQVALYLGGFALLAGPVIHLLFWRNQRRGWIWIAVPAASLSVAAGTYLAGVVLGGRDLMAHTLSHVRIDPRSGTATQAMMVGLYGPMHEDLAVTVNGNLPVNVLGLMEGIYWGPEGPPPSMVTPFRVVYGRTTRIEYNTGEWTMRPLAVTRTLGQETGRIRSHLTVDSDAIKGTVTNETPYYLEDAAVVVGRSVAKLGDLAPGQTAEVNLSAASGADPFRYYGASMLFYGEPLTEEELARRGISLPPGAPPEFEIPRDPEIRRRSQMLEFLLQPPTPGPGPAPLPLTFVAFTRDRVGPDLVDLKGRPNHHLHLIQQRLHLDLPAGPFTVPAAAIPYETTMATGGWGGGNNGTLVWMELHGGSITFTFIPPLPEQARITALELTTRLLGDPFVIDNTGRPPTPPSEEKTQAAVAGIFQIYNWQTGSWEDLPGGSESVRLTNPGPYVGPEHRVQVRVMAGPNRIVRFVHPQLTMEGRGDQ